MLCPGIALSSCFTKGESFFFYLFSHSSWFPVDVLSVFSFLSPFFFLFVLSFLLVSSSYLTFCSRLLCLVLTGWCSLTTGAYVQLPCWSRLMDTWKSCSRWLWFAVVRWCEGDCGVWVWLVCVCMCVRACCGRHLCFR
jgi:hypothetical protein